MKLNKMISAAMALTIAVGGGFYFNRPVETYAAGSYAEECSDMIDMINRYRAEAGVHPLKLNITACSIAQQRAQEISVHFAHERPDGRYLTTIFDEYGLGNTGMGENIAYGYADAQDVMGGWMASDGHRENILDSYYENIGIGLYIDNGTPYWVQIFLSDFDIPSRSLGDVNGDGNVDAIDASAVLEYYAYSATYSCFDETDDFKAAANVNADAAIDAVDASYILSYYAYRATGGTKNAADYFKS